MTVIPLHDLSCSGSGSEKSASGACSPLAGGDPWPCANVIWNDWIMASIAGLCVRCELRNLRFFYIFPMALDPTTTYFGKSEVEVYEQNNSLYIY